MTVDEMWWTDQDIEAIARDLHNRWGNEMPYELVKGLWREMAEVAVAALSRRKA